MQAWNSLYRLSGSCLSGVVSEGSRSFSLRQKQENFGALSFGLREDRKVGRSSLYADQGSDTRLLGLERESDDRRVVRAAASSSPSSSSILQPTSRGAGVAGALNNNDLVRQIYSITELDDALATAKSKLVVVEYAASHSLNSRKIYPAMVELSKSCQDVVFLLVLGDESDASRELCVRAQVEKVPHFVFYKNRLKIHEEAGITEETLLGDVLYYGDNDAPIYQIHTKEDFETLLNEHASDNKLVVLDVGLKNCGPCVKVYPTVVKLSKKLAGSVIFARMNGDENDDLMALLKQMKVIEVPTFLFIRDGKLCGRYVGSGKGELIGEILKYSGVRVT